VVSGLLDAFLDVEERFKLTAEPGSDRPTTEQEAVDAMRKVRCCALRSQSLRRLEPSSAGTALLSKLELN